MAEQDTPPIGRYSLRDARLAFPALFKKGKFGNYGASLIIPKNHPQLQDSYIHPKTKKKMPGIYVVMKAVAKAKWPDKWQSIYAALEKQNKLCVHDGDTKAEFEGFEGNLFVSASHPDIAPTVLDQLRNELTAADGKPYSGCYVVGRFDIWAQDNAEFGKRINARLRGVQFLRDGDAFSGGGKPADTDEFDEEDVSDTGGEPEEEVDIES